MPWYADGAPPEQVFADNNRKIPVHPKDDQSRVDCRFRFNYGQYLPAPRPSQFFFELRTEGFPDPLTRNGSLRLEAVSDTLLQGDAGVSPEGFGITFEIELFEFPVKDPTWDLSGIRYSIILTNAGFPPLYYRTLYRRHEDGGGLWVTLQQDKNFSVFPGPFDESNYDPLIHTYVTVGHPAEIFKWWPISECMSFVEPEDDGAEFNGVDAWISFPADLPYSTVQFKTEFDIRPNVVDEGIVVVGLARFGSFSLSIELPDKVQWWNRIINLSPGFAIGVWQLVRIEYNWSIPGAAYSVWIDDILQGTTATSFTIAPWDQMGKRGGLIAGTFNLKNFKEWGNTPASPIVRIDVPLIVDACAVTPPGVKGTTFFMPLPSCP